MINTIYEFYREAKKATGTSYNTVKVEIDYAGNIEYSAYDGNRSCWCSAATADKVIEMINGASDEDTHEDINLNEVNQPEIEFPDTPIAEHYENDFDELTF